VQTTLLTICFGAKRGTWRISWSGSWEREQHPGQKNPGIARYGVG
jgi:hypothetical protein